MNNVNQTLYIPLYGKSYVSKKGIILNDPKAEEIWAAESFPLKGKSKSKWLAYYMGMRSAVFDEWIKTQMSQDKASIILHIGCGMDSRVLRVGTGGHLWYDVDFPEVIEARKSYYTETVEYHMLDSDAGQIDWLAALPKGVNAIIVMEGVSMYFQPEGLQRLLKALGNQFHQIHLLMDGYTEFGAKASKYKNPINDVGVTVVYGIDHPKLPIQDTHLQFVKEHEMTPEAMINQLQGAEKVLFRKLFGGKLSKKMYRLYEYEKL